MRTRKTRLAVIVDILTHNVIGCQDELSKQLAIRGYIVTQATLSRDLKKLKTIKVANDMEGYRYIVTSTDFDNPAAPRQVEQSTVQSPLHPAAISLSYSGNIAVIKTRTGYASGIAYDLDAIGSDIILGTIAGADTVFMVVDEKVDREEVYNFFLSFLPLEVVEASRKYFFD